jgi:hypothetical protein
LLVQPGLDYALQRLPFQAQQTRNQRGLHLATGGTAMLHQLGYFIQAKASR